MPVINAVLGVPIIKNVCAKNGPHKTATDQSTLYPYRSAGLYQIPVVVYCYILVQVLLKAWHFPAVLPKWVVQTPPHTSAPYALPYQSRAWKHVHQDYKYIAGSFHCFQ